MARRSTARAPFVSPRRRPSRRSSRSDSSAREGYADVGNTPEAPKRKKPSESVRKAVACHGASTDRVPYYYCRPGLTDPGGMLTQP